MGSVWPVPRHSGRRATAGGYHRRKMLKCRRPLIALRFRQAASCSPLGRTFAQKLACPVALESGLVGEGDPSSVRNHPPRPLGHDLGRIEANVPAIPTVPHACNWSSEP